MVDAAIEIDPLTETPEPRIDVNTFLWLDNFAAERKYHFNLIGVCSLPSRGLLSLRLRQRWKLRHVPGKNIGHRNDL